MFVRVLLSEVVCVHGQNISCCLLHVQDPKKIGTLASGWKVTVLNYSHYVSLSVCIYILPLWT